MYLLLSLDIIVMMESTVLVIDLRLTSTMIRKRIYGSAAALRITDSSSNR